MIYNSNVNNEKHDERRKQWLCLYCF